MAFTINRALRWWSLECPDQVALSFEDQTCSFGELYAWSARVGDHLTGLGVKPGDRISMVAANSLEYAILAFGAMRIGAIGAPLSMRSTATEIRDAFSDLAPALVYTDADRYDTAAAALQGGANTPRSLAEIGRLRDGPAIDLRYEPCPDDPVFIIGTSGSTARPKGVVYTHRGVMTYASEFAITEPRCARGSRLLSVGPFSSSSGYLLLMQFSALGATQYLESKFEPQRALDLMVSRKITTFQAAPIFFERITALPGFAAADLSNLHWTQVGGARVKPGLLAAWRDKGVVLRQAYGSTEAGGGWGARDDTALDAPEKCGRGGMFTEYAVADADGGFAPPGTQGEILIRSACLTAGYWNNPEATNNTFRDGWLRTGDIGVMDAVGNLTFVDRLKDIVISGGLNISSAEVERVIAEMEGVEEVAVIAAPDRDFGETPCAVVYAGQAQVAVQAIIEHCNRHLANYKVPRYVALETEPLPRLPSGKISKAALRLRYPDAGAVLPKVR
jgi:fatty-acyl-CoA synthase